jgi:cell division cycle 20, cofactor of APC complex
MSITGVDVSSPMAQCRGSPLGTNHSTARVFGAKTPNRNAKKLDRFIPCRAPSDLQSSQVSLHNENVPAEDVCSPSKDSYQKLLAASMNAGEGSRVLVFKTKPPLPPNGYENALAALYSHNVGASQVRKTHRHIPQTQERVLDAPNIVDDYYLNVLDWSATNVVSWRGYPQ